MTEILRGWGSIELFTGESRTTLLRKKYPVHKDSGGSVWADPKKMHEHRLSISAQICSDVSISAHAASDPLK
jgi:hypothetical protein